MVILIGKQVEMIETESRSAGRPARQPSASALGKQRFDTRAPSGAARKTLYQGMTSESDEKARERLVSGHDFTGG